jgi:hypothetical protein
METDRKTLLDQLLDTAQSLPADKLQEALDFVGYLQHRLTAPPKPKRGSGEALLRHAGTIRFGLGEIDRLLSDIAQMRLFDMEAHA